MFFFVVLVAYSATPLSAADWSDTAWPFRQEIEITDQLTDAPLSNFPLLIRIENGDNPVFERAQSNAADIYFTGSDGTTRIPHEIEHYETSGGNEALFAWVRVPEIPSGGTTVYMYYGNPDAASQEDPAAVWDDGFELVMHLNENLEAGETGGEYLDSSPNGYSGVQYNSGWEDGRVAGAQFFNGDDAGIDLGNIPSDDWTAITAEAWIRVDEQKDSRVFSKASDSTTAEDYVFMLGITTATNGNSRMRVRFGTEDDHTGSFDIELPDEPFGDSEAWHHIAFTWDSADETVRAYLNGEEQDTDEVVGTSLMNVDSADELTIIGSQNLPDSSDDRWFHGGIDEVRLSRVTRSAEWLLASVRTQRETGYADYVRGFSEQVAVSGALQSRTGASVAGEDVRLRIEGDLSNDVWEQRPTATTRSDGSFTLGVPTEDYILARDAEGDATVVYVVDPQNPDNRASTVFSGVLGGFDEDSGIDAPNGVSGLTLRQGHLLTRSELDGYEAPEIPSNTTLQAANPGAGEPGGDDEYIVWTHVGSEIEVRDGFNVMLEDNQLFRQEDVFSVPGGDLIISANAAFAVTAAGFSVGGAVTGEGLLSATGLSAGSLQVDGDFLISTYEATDGETRVGGDWDVSAFSHNDGTVVFTGTGTVSAAEFAVLEIDADAETRTAVGPLVISDQLVLTAGTFSPGSFTHRVAGDWDDSAVEFRAGNGTIRLTGTGVQITQDEANHFHNLRVDDNAALQSPVTVQGNLRFLGELDSDGNDITLWGDFRNDGGSFLPGAGNLILENSDFTSTILGGNAFNDLTIDSDTARSKTVRFEAGETQSIGGTFAAAGSPGAEFVSLLSTQSGSRWFLDTAGGGTTDVQAVVLQDSRAITGDGPLTASQSFDAGNNVNWVFDDPQDHWVWVGLEDDAYRVSHNGDGNRNWYGFDQQAGEFRFAPRDSDGNSLDGPEPGTRIYVPAEISQELVDAFNDQFVGAGAALGDRAMPRLTQPESHEQIVIGEGAEIDTDGNDMTPNSLVNRGTIRRTVDGTVTRTPNRGTVLYYGTAGTLETYGETEADYYNLILAGDGEYQIDEALESAGDLTLNGGDLAAGEHDVTVAGDAVLAEDRTLTLDTGALEVEGTLSGGGELNAASGDVTVHGSFSPGTYNATEGVTAVGGDWSVSSFDPNNGTVEFTAEGTIGGPSGGRTFHTLRVTGLERLTGGAVIVADDLEVTSGGHLSAGSDDLTVFGSIVGDGELAAGTGTVRVGEDDDATAQGDGNITIATYSATSGVTRVAGLWDVANFNPNGGTVVFYRGGDVIANGGLVPEDPEEGGRLSLDTEFANLQILESASLYTVGHSITISGEFSNAGTLFRTGSAGESVSKNDVTQGTVAYVGDGGTVQTYSGTDYFNLTIVGDDAGDEFNVDADMLEIAGSYHLLVGDFDANLHLRIRGDLFLESTTDSTFDPRPDGILEFYDSSVVSRAIGQIGLVELRITAPGKRLEIPPRELREFATFDGVVDNDDDNRVRILPEGSLNVAGTPAQPIELGRFEGDEGDQWSFEVRRDNQSVEYVSVGDSDAGDGDNADQEITAFFSIDRGNNTDNWNFVGQTFTWVGDGANGDWEDRNNWELADGSTPPDEPGEAFPGEDDTVIIPDDADTTGTPDLGADRTLGSLTIEPGGVLGHELTVQDSFSNSGTVRRHLLNDPLAPAMNVTDTGSGLTVYYGNDGGYIQDYGSPDYHDLALEGVTGRLAFDLRLTGSLSIDGAGTLDAEGRNIRVAGDWNNQNDGAGFAAGGGYVRFDGTGESEVSGNTVFADLRVTTSGKTVTFDDGSTQTITDRLELTGASTNRITLQSSDPDTPWNLNVAGGAEIEVTGVVVSDSDASDGQEILAQASIDAGGNENWRFANYFEWTGGDDSEVWEEGENWEGGAAAEEWPGDPGREGSEQDIVTIPGNAPLWPELSQNITIGALTIEDDAEVDVTGSELTIQESFTNAGTLRRAAGSSVSRTDTTSGTVVYYGLGFEVQDYGSVDYHNLVLGDAGDDGRSYELTASLRVTRNLSGEGVLDASNLTASSAVVQIDGDFSVNEYQPTAGATRVGADWLIDGFDAGGVGRVVLFATGGLSGGSFRDLTIESGTRTLEGSIEVTRDLRIETEAALELDSNDEHEITVGRDWRNAAGSSGFASGSGTVRLVNPQTAQVRGETVFWRLISTEPGKRIRFVAGAEQTILNELRFVGEEDNLLRLTSTSSGSEWRLNVDNDALLDVRRVEVQDSDASPGRTIETEDSEDAGNNTNWLFVDLVTNLEWTGVDDTNWHNADNWSPNMVPDADLSVLIPETGNDPEILDENAEARSIVVEPDAVLTLSGPQLTVTDTFRIEGVFTGNGGSIDVGGDLEVPAGGEFTSPDGAAEVVTLEIAGDLVVAGIFVAPGTSDVAVRRDVDLSQGTFEKGTNGGRVVLDGSDGLQRIRSGGNDLGNLLVTGADTVASLRADAQFDDVTIADEATFDLGANHTARVAGDWTNLVGAGGFEAQAGLVEFNADGEQTAQTGEAPFYDLTKSGGERLTFVGDPVGDQIVVDGTLRIDSAGDLVDFRDISFEIDTLENGGTLELTGEQAQAIIASMDTDSGLVRYYGGEGTVFAFAGIPGSYFDLAIEGDDGASTFTAEAALELAGELDVQQGVFDLNGGDLTVGASVTIAENAVLDAHVGVGGANNTISVGGNWTNGHTNDGFVARESTVRFEGDEDQTVQSAGSAFATVEIEKGDGSIEFSDTLVAQALTPLAGTYDVLLLGGGTVTEAVEFLNTGMLTLGGDEQDEFQFTGGLTATAPSEVRVGGEITTGSNDITLGDDTTGVVLIADTTMSTGVDGGNITFGGAVDSSGDGEETSDGHELMLAAGTGDVSFAAGVGEAADGVLGALEVTNAGEVRFAADVATSGAQNITADLIKTSATHSTSGGQVRLEGAVELDADTTMLTEGGSVELTSTVNTAPEPDPADEQGLEIDAGDGEISITGPIGDERLLRYLRLSTTAHGFELPELAVAEELEVTAGGEVTQSGPLTGATLHVKTRDDDGASITLEHEGNDFDTVVLETRNQDDDTDAAGDISYRDAAGFDLGALGIEDAAIRTTADTTLRAAGGVTQSGQVISGGLRLTGDGPYTLTMAENDITTLAAATVGEGAAVEYNDANEFTVGTVGETEGISTTNGAVTLTTEADGSVTLTEGISSGSGDVVIETPGLTSVLAGGEISTTTGDVRFGETEGSGAVETAGDVTTDGGSVTYYRPVTLTGDVEIGTGDDAAGEITFQDTLDGGHNLTLAAGEGSIVFADAVGSDTPVGSGNGEALMILGAAAGVEFESTVDAASGVDIEPNVIFRADVTLAAGDETEGAGSRFGGEVELQGIEVSAARSVTFEAAVVLESAAVDIATTANDGDLAFEAGISGAQDLSISTHGEGSVSFGADVTVGATETDALEITAGGVDLAEGVDIDTSGGGALNGDIRLTVDRLTLESGNTINAGTGDVTLTPRTETLSVEFGDTNTGVADVYYSSAWENFIADSFTVGSETHSGTITLTGTNEAPYALTVINGDNGGLEGAIEVIGNYSSEDEDLRLEPGSGGVVFGDGSDVSVDLGAGALTITAAVTLRRNAEITANGGIAFASTVDADAAANERSLTLNSSGETTVDGAIGGSEALSGVTTTGGGSTTVANVRTRGDQSYGDDVIFTGTEYSTDDDDAGGSLSVSGSTELEADVTVSSGAGDVTFGGTVNGEQSLTVNGSGRTSFEAAVGGDVALTGLTVDAGGQTELGANVTTDGEIEFANAVELDASVIITSGGNSIEFGSTIDGDVDENHNLELRSRTGDVTVDGTVANIGVLTLHDDNVGSTGTMRFEGSVTAQQLVTVGRGYEVLLLGGGTVTEAVEFLNTGGVTIEDGFEFIGGVQSTTDGINSFAGTVETGGTAGADITLSNLTIGAGGVHLDAGVDGEIEVQDELAGNGQDLELTAGGGAVFGDAVVDVGSGDGRAITANAGGPVEFQDIVTTNSGMAISPDLIFNGNVTIGPGNTDIDTQTNFYADVTFSPEEDEPLEFDAARDVTFGDDGGPDPPFTVDVNSGPVSIRTTANDGNIVFNSLIESDQELTIESDDDGNVELNYDLALTGGSPLTIRANVLELADGVVISTADGGNDGDIVLEVDGLELAGPNEVDAGEADVTLTPRTETLSVEFGDERLTGADVYYNSAWEIFTAGSFTVGAASHIADITLSGVSNAPYALTVRNDDARIRLTGDYSSTGENLELDPGDGDVSFEADSVDLDGGELTVVGSALIAENLTLTLTLGVGTFEDTVDAAGGDAPDLTLLVGGGGMLQFQADVGEAAPLGHLQVDGEGTVRFADDTEVRLGSFEQTEGTVELGADDADALEFIVSGSFLLEDGTFRANSALLDIGNNFTVTEQGAFNEGSSELRMSGAGDLTIALDGDDIINRLHALTIAGDTVVLQNPIDLAGDLTIESGGVLDVGANDHIIYLGGSWINEAGIGGFQRRQSAVVLYGTANTESEHERLMSGATSFYHLVAVQDPDDLNTGNLPDALQAIGLLEHSAVQPAGDDGYSLQPGGQENVVIQVGAGGTIRLGGIFYLRGQSEATLDGGRPEDTEDWLVITSTADDFGLDGWPDPAPDDPEDDDEPVPDAGDYWRFEAEPGSTLEGTVFKVIVRYSEADPPVDTPENVYARPRINIGWLTEVFVTRSRTLDRSGSGKIDTIVVSVEVGVNYNFDAFEVEVEGYELAEPAFGPDGGGTDEDNLDVQGTEFYIRLEEGPDLDTDARPRWRITRNDSLQGLGGFASVELPEESDVFPDGELQIDWDWDDYFLEVDGDVWARPRNAAHPVIGYTLGVLGKDEIYIRFSEPVAGDETGRDLAAGDFDVVIGGEDLFGGIRDLGDGSEYILELNRPLEEGDILEQLRFEALGVFDRAATIADDDDSGPNVILTPENAVDPGLDPAYADTDELPDRARHRVTDIALGRTGDSMLEPILARNLDAAAVADPERGGLGTVREFDGSEFLQRGELVLQAFRTDATEDLSNNGGDPDPVLWYDANVPNALVRGGVWLPDFDETDFSGLVPYPNAERPRALSEPSDVNNNSNLLQYDGPQGSFVPDGVPDRSDFEFWFELPYEDGNDETTPLFFGRIESPGSAQWYRTVRPWKFHYRDVRTQRGGVTIHNNVINPERGEKAELHYELDSSGMVTINVFNLAGDLVDQLYRGRRDAGEYSTSWDGRNRGGYAVARGIYFVRVVGPGIDEYRKVMVVK